MKIAVNKYWNVHAADGSFLWDHLVYISVVTVCFI